MSEAKFVEAITLTRESYDRLVDAAKSADEMRLDRARVVDEEAERRAGAKPTHGTTEYDAWFTRYWDWTKKIEARVIAVDKCPTR